MKQASSSSRLAFVVSHLPWAALWLIGRPLAVRVERLRAIAQIGLASDQFGFEHKGRGRLERGALICSRAIGASVRANQQRGVRAAFCRDLYSAQPARWARGRRSRGTQKEMPAFASEMHVEREARAVAPSAIASRRLPNLGGFLNGQSEKRVLRRPPAKGTNESLPPEFENRSGKSKETVLQKESGFSAVHVVEAVKAQLREVK